VTPAPRRSWSARRGTEHPARWWGRVLCGAVVVVCATACASGPVDVPVPTFEAAPPPPTRPLVVEDTGDGLPAECAELVGNDELSALFGLPVDSVTVQTVVGAPSPSVGRLERLTCTYTMSPGPVGSRPQGVVLRMTVGTYANAAAAHDQHERNMADEGAGGSSAAQPGLGAVVAGLVQRDADSVLLTSVDTVTLDLDLPPRQGPLPPADLLVDLARRVLARLAPARSDAAP
jgi:hypothetical protein